MSKRNHIVVHGASGRMGMSLLRLAREWPLTISAALVRPGCKMVGESVAKHVTQFEGTIEFTDSLDPDIPCDALIDFSHGESFSAALELARYRQAAFISGTTGLNPLQQTEVQHAAQTIPVLWSANFSLGIALLTRLARLATSALGPEADVEIIEAHHRHKQDAPSGTALHLGRAIADTRGIVLETQQVCDRSGELRARRDGEIGISSIRAGDIIGDHTVMFGLEGERITLSHVASNRDLFARGALRAACWAAGQAAGLYRMEDVLG